MIEGEPVLDLLVKISDNGKQVGLTVSPVVTSEKITNDTVTDVLENINLMSTSVQAREAMGCDFCEMAAAVQAKSYNLLTISARRIGIGNNIHVDAKCVVLNAAVKSNNINLAYCYITGNSVEILIG